ncbi:MAG: EAL domain-containing protein [Sulfuricurvum sp.]|jgi:diguanylate cyclase (GGDEF)-like protein/PAS domain S-box-containing protein|uniref:sensor domain-containing protein n=1 Tax=Sulfuricurvum sp. TaxID=2025608 RepID=UPI0025D8DF4A|nr:EAL domain-containing protein [Sulfuricurvum sp.]MCK9371921.1 EAL domain-containing protein [Sulfuricurvum sp.]
MRHFTLHYANNATLVRWLESCSLTPSESQLIQIFNTLADPELLRRITATIYEFFPNATIIGTTTSGEIFRGETPKKQILISLCTFDQITLHRIHLTGDDLIMNEEKAKLEEELIESNKNLRSQHIFLETLLENSPIPIYHKSIEGIYLGCNSAFADIIGLDKNEFIGKNVFDIALPEFALTCSAKDQELLACPQSTQVYEYQLQNQITDEMRDGIFYKRAYCNEKEEVVGIIGSFIDITERKRAENEFFKLSQAVEQSPASIIITDLMGNIEYANTNFYTINGYSPDEVIGQNPRLFQSGKTPRSTYESLWNHLRRHEKWHGEFINRSKDGTEYIQSVNISPIFQPDGKITHYMAIEEDITEKKRSEEQIYHLANFDSLTGLPNRAQLQNYFNHTLNLSKRNNTPFVVMFLDLDHFKEINDTLGHTIGDRMLVESAKRFRSLISDVDIVARLGGDEFIIVLSDTDAHGAERLLQKLFEAISHPYHIEQYGLNISASVGIAIYPTDGKDIETLSKNADTAMYRAKQEGRNGYRFFTEEMQTSSLRNLRLNNALRNALKNNEFHLLYQPQISIQAGKVIGAEALIRWNHPELGNVSPAEFIPVAEENGLILPIGEWVLRTAIAQVREWMEGGQSPIVMSVNLSTVQFRHHDLPNLVSRILHENNVPAEYLELELTESMATHNPHSAITIMNNFHARGIRMSIDDFGTGYSSLSYLKQFKIYKLKIDQSFVRDITTDADDKAIVSAVINMAHSLGLQTIAEGVETLEQLRYLREQGCDEIQGYYFSKPIKADLFKTFVATYLPLDAAR